MTAPRPKGRSGKSTELNGYNTSVRIMKAIQRRVAKEVERLRPAYYYAYVTSLNYSDYSATVTDNPNDENASEYRVQADSATMPSYVGQKVRIAGISSDKYIDGLVGRADNSLLPGVILDYGGAAAPVGFLVCDGSTVNIADYPGLFAAIGVNYGGDGVSNFKIPNFTNRFARGGGPSTGGGADSHAHSLSGTNAQALIFMTGGTLEHKQSGVISPNWVPDWTAPMTRAAAATSRQFGTSLTGSTDSASNLPAYTGVRKIIKL